MMHPPESNRYHLNVTCPRCGHTGFTEAVNETVNREMLGLLEEHVKHMDAGQKGRGKTWHDNNTRLFLKSAELVKRVRGT